MGERWAPVVGYEDLYEVSDQGRVRSLDRAVAMPPSRRHPEPWTRTISGRILKPGGKSGQVSYLTVALHREGVGRSESVHILVCAAFHGPRPEGQHVRHLNGKPRDNRAVNLAWGSRSENMLDRRAHGTDHQVNKEYCPQGHKYTPENTRYYRTSRVCRKCHARESNRRYHEGKQLKGPRPKKTHCVNGHPLDGNQYASSGGCKICTRVRAGEWKRAQKAARAQIRT